MLFLRENIRSAEYKAVPYKNKSYDSIYLDIFIKDKNPYCKTKVGVIYWTKPTVVRGTRDAP